MLKCVLSMCKALASMPNTHTHTHTEKDGGVAQEQSTCLVSEALSSNPSTI
jgi:hypothetical protein